MATLNGAEFKIIEAEWSTYQNNVIQEILGSDTVEVQNQGHGSEPVRIQGMVNNEKEMDDFQEQFYSNGVLTLIKDPDSGRQYQVYALGNVRREAVSNSLFTTGIIFTCTVQLKYPYSESVETITRSKSITTQNQEWSADDDGNSLKTDGNVDAVPDIKVTSVGQATFDEITNYDVGGVAGPPTGMTWDGSNMWICDTANNKIHKLNSDMSVNTSYNSPSINPTGLAWDGSNMWSCDAWLDKIYKHDAAMAVLNTYDSPANVIFGLTWDGNNIWSCDRDTAKIYKHDTDIITILGTYDSGGSAPQGLTWDGFRIHSCDLDTDKIYKYDNSMAIIATRTAPTLQGTGLAWINPHIYQCSLSPEKIYKLLETFDNLVDVDIYNTSNSSIKCSVASSMLTNAIHRINADGTGTISYSDDFSADIHQFDSTNLNCTIDTTNDELDIGDDGYIYWKEDTKFPINGTPTLTSRINITSGIPTIQISTDASTWYNIDTAIVDDVETEYPLDSDGNLSLAGKTIFYFRIDCVKAAAATCSIKSFELDVILHTIYAKNPKIAKGSSVSTFRIDQDSDSGMVCTVDLVFKNWWWV